MKFVRLSIVISAVILCVHSAGAQITQVARYEIEQKNADNSFTIISMKERGLALVRDRNKFLNSEKIYEIHTLDTTLVENGYVEIGVNTRMNLIGYENVDDYLYILLRTGENETHQMLLIEYNLKTKEVSRYEIKHEFNLRLTHFTVLGRHAIFGGYVAREPAVLIYDVAEAQLKVVPGFFTSDTELLDLRINANGTFNTLHTNRSNRTDKVLVLRTYDQTGTQLMEDEIPIDPKKNILSGLTSSLVRDELLIAGTYSTNNSKVASGFFAVPADPFKEQPVHYYDFAQLNHFLDYMSERRAEKVKVSSEKSRERSKDPDFRVNVSNVKLEERDAGFYLLAEIYNTVTATNPGPYPYYGYFPTYSPYGMMGYSPYSSRFYNSPYGYANQQMHHDFSMLSTSVLAFNPDGTLDWDHSLKSDNARKPVLEQVADFWCDKNKIVIATKSESEVVVNARFKNNESEGDTIKILQKKPTDIVKNEIDNEGGVRHWYGNKFYMFGYQSVRDPELKFEDRNRSVFYLVKIDAY